MEKIAILQTLTFKTKHSKINWTILTIMELLRLTFCSVFRMMEYNATH